MEASKAPDPRFEAVLTSIRGQVNRQQFETWFRELHPVSFHSDLVRFAVPSVFLKDWLHNYYEEILTTAIRLAVGGEPELDIVIDESLANATPTRPAPETEEPSKPESTWTAAPGDPNEAGLRRNSKYPHFLSDVLLNDRYTFDHFVDGPSNRLPHAAAVAVAEQPARAYNPLFLHGSVGLGKTHLLQAICHSILVRRKDLKILYLSCETFTNQFIAAVKSGNLRNFRYRYRHVDVLLIDDINFLAKKEQTQEEFFHTFNALYNSGSQIVLSSDSSPKDIPTLEERLVSRFKWGLVAEIEPPCFETRMLIVKHKARVRNRPFPDDVCQFVADRFSGNIRELEGAILKVISVADLLNRPVDLDVARSAVKNLITPAQKKITVERIIDIVTQYYDIKQTDLQSRKRSKSIAFPRQVCMFLARRMTNHSLEEIGGYFGGRDHTTVIYATEKIRKLYSGERKFKEELETLIQDIEG
jgi:chromosomal replication initiator protein